MTTQSTDKADSRRAFLARAGKAAAAAPAVGLVLAASDKPAKAARVYRNRLDAAPKSRRRGKNKNKNKD